MIIKNIANLNSLDDLEVAPGVYFPDNTWHIVIDQSEHISLQFNGILDSEGSKLSNFPDLNKFLKILTYYSFPDSVTTNARSWVTTSAHFKIIRTFAREFLFKNFLVTNRLIASIDGEQIKGFLDYCARGADHSPLLAFLTINLPDVLKTWVKATETNGMPQQFKSTFTMLEVISKEFEEKRCAMYVELESNTWQPLTAHQIKLCYKNASDYIYKFSDAILEVSYLLNGRPRIPPNGQLAPVRKDGRTKNLFKLLEKYESPKFPGTENKIFEFNTRTNRYKCRSGYSDRTTIDIKPVRPETINLKRACIFIIGLLTGLRRKEIAHLKCDPLVSRDGVDYMKITRFKVSSDPKKGTPDEIPIPAIVADAVRILIKLFQVQRTALKSNYLLVSDIVTSKAYKKIKIDTVGKDICCFILDSSGEAGHTHQLRKTIAWLLISQSEENVDLIRQLFGHKSYRMTLRYILRNELLSGSVMELLEENYTQDLHEALNKIASGDAVGDLANTLRQRSVDCYPGQILASEIEAFVHSALESGVPLFISRIPIGGFCINSSDISKKKPPCIDDTDEGKPNPEFCDYLNCPHVLHTSESVENVKSQISFYEKKQKHLPEFGDDRIQHYYESKIEKNKTLLEQLRARANIIIATDSETKNG
tara:strand:- start:2717 stop:4663 length:1947 start_codon:yes stop_codon:yes gene_type:complete